MEIRKPVIVIGTGRCGSSVFSTTLAKHPSMAYMTALSEKHPDKKWLHRGMMQALDWPVAGKAISKRLGLAEAYSFWGKHDNGFARPVRDLTAMDVRNNVRASVTRDLAGLLTPSRDRLLLKFTGWPRLGYLNELFPDAYFIHVVRDGRSVANSNIATPQWWGWRGPQNWRLGELPPDLAHQWEESGRSFVVLAGMYWKIIVDAVEESKPQFPADRFMEIRYEDMIAQPETIFRDAADFAELEWDAEFVRTLKATRFYDPGPKWLKNFTGQQVAMLEECLGPTLDRYGYRWRASEQSVEVPQGTLIA